MRAINRLIFHHSASSLATTAEDITRWHTENNGWDFVGYHFIVESNGKVVPGRDLDMTGAHAKGANGDSVGICLVGSNDVSEETWTQQQIDATNELVGALRRVLGVPLTIHGHRDVGTTVTLCPGVDVVEVLHV